MRSRFLLVVVALPLMACRSGDDKALGTERDQSGAGHKGSPGAGQRPGGGTTAAPPSGSPGTGSTPGGGTQSGAGSRGGAEGVQGEHRQGGSGAQQGGRGTQQGSGTQHGGSGTRQGGGGGGSGAQQDGGSGR
jgi:hypothetical protein